MRQPHHCLQAHVAPRRQRGAVLIVSLVLLVILTLLGVSMMGTTKLEERMAANTQESTQAFQSAETGLSQGYDDNNAWAVKTTANEQTSSQPVTQIPGTPVAENKTSQYVSSFIATTGPPSGYDVTQFQTAHFDFQSTGTNSTLTTMLHGGGFQVFRRTGAGL